MLVLSLCACGEQGDESSVRETTSIDNPYTNLQLGFARADITPAISVPLAGYGTAESKLQVQVELTWNGGQNRLMAVYTDDVLENYLNNWDNDGCLLVTVTNLGSISDLRYVAKVVFAQDTEAEVVKAGSAVTQGAQQ